MIPTRHLAPFPELEKDSGDAAPSTRHTSSGGLLGTSVANLTPVYEPKFSDSGTKRLDFPSPQSWSSDPQCNVASAAAAPTSGHWVIQGVIQTPFAFRVNSSLRRRAAAFSDVCGPGEFTSLCNSLIRHNRRRGPHVSRCSAFLRDW